MTHRIVYLTRGLPSCGKSYTAKQLASSGGVILETDAYFCKQGADGTVAYEYREDHLPAARRWNFERFQQAIAADVAPIIVDRGNGLNSATQQYARYAVDHGYQVELREPDSPWWLEIRRLLQDKQVNRDKLLEWVQRLADMSRTTHRVPAATIQSWMEAWNVDLTVADILNYRSAR